LDIIKRTFGKPFNFHLFQVTSLFSSVGPNSLYNKIFPVYLWLFHYTNSVVLISFFFRKFASKLPELFCQQIPGLQAKYDHCFRRYIVQR
jgi:hypothetical protein